MFYFEVMVAETSSMRQRATTTALGPFVVEAMDEGAARMLIGINYETIGGYEFGEQIAVPIWDDPSASDARRMTFAPGVRQALAAGRDQALDDLKQPELVWDGQVVARMIWWPCAGPDIYPFGDALLFDVRDVDGFARQPATV